MEAALNVLLRALATNVRDARRVFFCQTIGCRRRFSRRWQETPLARVFLLPDAFAMLKQRSLALRIKQSIKARNWLLFDAFHSKFDTDKNGELDASELQKALTQRGEPPDSAVMATHGPAAGPRGRCAPGPQRADPGGERGRQRGHPPQPRGAAAGRDRRAVGYAVPLVRVHSA